MVLGKKKKQQMTGWNSRYVNVVVEKLTNGNLWREVAEFVAVQDKSEGKSLVIKNFEMDFVEELDFTENDLISHLKETMFYKDLPREDKLKKIEDKISEQEKRLKNIKDGYIVRKKFLGYKKDDKGNFLFDKNKQKIPIYSNKETEKEKVNWIDEDRSLRLLRVMKEHIQNYDDKGAYEYMNSRGMREIRFAAVGDFLYPLYRSPNKMTIYPNMVTKKKVYKVQSDLARKEFEDATMSKVKDFLKNARPIFEVLFMIVLIFWSVNLGAREADLQGTIQEEVNTYQKMLSKCQQKTTEAATKSAFFVNYVAQQNKEIYDHASTQMSMITEAMNETVNDNKDKVNKLRENATRKVVDETTD